MALCFATGCSHVGLTGADIPQRSSMSTAPRHVADASRVPGLQRDILTTGSLPDAFSSLFIDGYSPQHVKLQTVAMPAIPQVVRDKLLSHFSTSTRLSRSIVNSSDSGGQGGYYWLPSTSLGDGSVWVAQDAVPPVQNGNAVFLPAPNPCNAGTSCGNWLYAPTTHGSNGNCLEVSSAYNDNSTNPGFTSYYLLLTDFCYQQDGHNEFVQIPMDSNFFDNYVRIYSNGDGRPEYCVELQKDGATWRVLLYNNLLQQYDDVYDAVGLGTNNGQDGWSIYETHFNFNVQPGYTMPCPSLPNIGASGVRINPGGIWQKIGGAAQQRVSYPNDCFSSNSSTGDVYTLQYNSLDSAFVGISSNDGRNPSTSTVSSGAGTPGGTSGGSGGTGGCRTSCPQ